MVAGLVTGNGAARRLSPQARQSDQQTWHAIELVLEGAVYLILGLELLGTIEDVERDHQGVAHALTIALVVLVGVLTVRALFIAPLLWWQARRAGRARELQPHVEHYRELLQDPERHEAVRRQQGWLSRLLHRASSSERIDRRLTRVQADLSYFVRGRLGPRDGVIMVWAGMRGVVTVAAAQTLPTDTPGRSLLVLVAYLVAILSLVIQGGTVAWVVRRVKPSMGASPAEQRAERERLDELMDKASARARREFESAGRDGRGSAQHRAVISARRDALLDARDLGTFSSPVLSQALHELDVEQIRLEL